MTARRLLLLQIILIAGLSCAFLVPAQTKFQPVGVSMDLPESVGQWTGARQSITQAELDQLAADTTFSRRLYSNPFGDQILVSIVLAGEDPDNSIHRPERCLPAQGWTIMDSRTVAIKYPAASGGSLQATRLHNEQTFKDGKGGEHTVYNLNYYWFVGYNRVTPSHIERALVDIHDRVFKGYNQRWAYVTVASNITQGLVRFGRSEADTDRMLQLFIEGILPSIAKPTIAGSADRQTNLSDNR
jgi:EpsI family protein